MSSAGVTVNPIETLTGQSEFCEVFLDDVRVPRENLIGAVHGGWSLAMDTLANERGGYLLRRATELDLAFDDLVREIGRQQDAGLDPDYAAIGECRCSLDALNAQARKLAARLSCGGPPSAADSTDKLLLSSAEQALMSVAVDHLGNGRMVATQGMGSTAAAQWTDRYLWSRASSIYSGTRQIQRSIVAERILGLPKSR
jgi:alkylation response protein AidB-like acyl-CoA dehydrogenase